jgi:hypothetical protein
MASVPEPRRSSRRDVPTLESGDRLTQAEFHRIYEQMPENFKAELVGGVVYVASPLRQPHANYHSYFDGLLAYYCFFTPGVEPGNNATLLLGELSEPQPDLYLRILAEYGGRSHITDKEFVKGPPEWLGEIAHSSIAIDLNEKRRDYRTCGVLEYVVLCVRDQRLRWFDLQKNRELEAEDGIIRSLVFPGLWIDCVALLQRDGPRMLASLQRGIATPEYAAFAKSLKERHAELEAESKTVPMSPKPRAGKKPTRKRKKS